MTTWEALPLTRPSQPAWVKWIWDPAAETALAVDNTNATLTVYRLPRFDKGPALPLEGPAGPTSMSPDGQVLAVAVQDKGSGSHRVFAWDLARNALIGKTGDYDADIAQLRLSSDRKTLALRCVNGVIGIWDMSAWSARASPPAPVDASSDDRLLFLDNGRLLHNANWVSHVWNWTIQTDSVLAPAGIGQEIVNGFSPEGNYLITQVNRQTLNLFDAGTLQLIGTLRGHSGIVLGIGYSPDGKLFATASADQTARVWNLATQQEVATLGGFGELISDVKFSADSQSLILLSGSGKIKVYQLSTVLNRGVFAATSDPGGFCSIALAHDERTLAARTLRGTVAVWDQASRTQIWSQAFGVPKLALEGANFGNLAFSPDDKKLAWTTQDALRILSLTSGQISTTPLDGNRDAAASPFHPMAANSPTVAAPN